MEKPQLVLITREMVDFLSRIQVKPSITEKLIEVIRDRSASEIGAILLYLARFGDLKVIDRTLADFLQQSKDQNS